MMHPSELIPFLMVGMLLLLIIAIVWLTLRQRPKLATTISAILVILYITAYALFPTYQKYEHERRYVTLVEAISSPHLVIERATFDPKTGDRVGVFSVYDERVPQFGWTYKVSRNNDITNDETWSRYDYPAKDELWQEVEWLYWQETETGAITELDRLEDGPLVAYAFETENERGIALFHYENEGMTTLAFEHFPEGATVTSHNKTWTITRDDDTLHIQ